MEVRSPGPALEHHGTNEDGMGRMLGSLPEDPRACAVDGLYTGQWMWKIVSELVAKWICSLKLGAVE